MEFEKGKLYHIFNQGNNKIKIFYKRENYLFFLAKLKTYVSPYADILAWCLMPNHFHLMVRVNEVKLVLAKTESSDGSLKLSQPTRTLNNSIAILLRSYTRAINKQENMSGSLFKSHTKAVCINCFNGLTPSYYTQDGITQVNIENPENQYPQVCFNYIHQNPVKAHLVKTASDWEFSSAKEYAGLRDGKLVNKEVALQFVYWAEQS